MPRTKARKAPTKRNRNSDEDSNLVNQLKEMQRMHDAFESESSMVRQERKEEIRDIFQKLRCRFSQPILDSTISDLMKPKPTKSDSLGAESSMASKNDDGVFTTILINKHCFFTNFTFTHFVVAPNS